MIFLIIFITVAGGFLLLEEYCRVVHRADRLEHLLDSIWEHVAPDQTTKDTPMTEEQKAQRIKDIYESQKTAIAADKVTIQQLQDQVANGTPVTADQLAALKINDALSDEIDADTAAPVDSAAPAPDSAS